MNQIIPLSVPNLQGNELEYVTDTIKTEWVSTGGSYINKFENAIAEYTGAKGAVACQNGTAGLHLALLACGVKKNEEVIVPTLTFIAAVNPIKYIDAFPIFMDCDDSLCIDPDKVERFLEEECRLEDKQLVNKSTNRKVTAILIVHIFGNMADMDRFSDIAQKYHLKLIEDATEALGSYYLKEHEESKKSTALDKQYAGTMGDMGVYSFNGNKIITCGGGGMIVSNNVDLLKRAKHLSTQAKTDEIYYEHDEIGFNYRMTNLQAAVGLAQLEQLEKFIMIKNNNYDYYKKHDIELLEFQKNVRSNKWFYTYITDYRDEFIRFCMENQIQTRPIWKLIHTTAPYQDAQSYNIEKAYHYYDKIVNIPCSTNITEYGLNTVIDAIKSFTNVMQKKNEEK